MIFIFLIGLIASVADVPMSPIPLGTGTQWVYEGTVSWTVENSAIVKSKQIRWSTEVLAAATAGTCQVAILSGFVFDLAWYDPSQPVRFTVILKQGPSVYSIAVENKADARRIFAQLVQNMEELPDNSKLLLSLPLAEGKKWDNDPERSDNLYCWFVESVRKEPLNVKGVSSEAPQDRFVLAYRTLPDHHILEIVPGVGIVHYVFEHHGTVASADVHLVEFKVREIPQHE